MIVNDKSLAIQAALQGIGIAFCVDEAVEPHLRSGALRPLLEDWSQTFPGIHLCYPQQRQMAPALRAFIDAVRQSAQISGNADDMSCLAASSPSDVPALPRVG